MKMTSDRCSAVLALAACGLLAGCKATPPNKFETSTVNWTKRHITVGNKKTKNPVPATAESVAEGKQLFGSYCMVCHGLDGQNTGVPFARTISPPVPSLTDAHVQAYTDGQLWWIIKNGIEPSGMPPSTGEFSDDDMWAMVNYIRHLPPAGSLGEPNVYGGSGGGRSEIGGTTASDWSTQATERATAEAVALLFSRQYLEPIHS